MPVGALEFAVMLSMNIEFIFGSIEIEFTCSNKITSMNIGFVFGPNGTG